MYVLSRVLLLFLCLCGTGLGQDAHVPSHFLSPDGKWDAVMRWIGDRQGNGDWFLMLTETATQKALPGPRVEPGGRRAVLWSPDSHFLAMGGIVLAVEEGKLRVTGCPWTDAALRDREIFEVSLLKDADKKRYLAHLRAVESGASVDVAADEDRTYCRIFPLEWANNTDLIVHCSLRVLLENPRELLDAAVNLTVLVGNSGAGRILRTRYDAYETEGKDASPDAEGDMSPAPEEEQKDVAPLTCTLATPREAPEGRKYESEQAPEPCGLQVFTFRPLSDGRAYEIWVRESATGRASRLYVYRRGAQVTLSPNGKYMAIVDRGFSNVSLIAILERDAKGDFHRVKTGDIVQKGVRLMGRLFELTPLPEIDHIHCAITEAPRDDGVLLIAIWGYVGAKDELEQWCFRYNIATGKTFVRDEDAEREAGSPLHPLRRGR